MTWIFSPYIDGTWDPGECHQSQFEENRVQPHSQYSLAQSKDQAAPSPTWIAQGFAEMRKTFQPQISAIS